MRAVIVDGPPNLAQAVFEWQALAAECVTLADKLQGLRGQAAHLEALLLATIPDDADAVRNGGTVISRLRNRLHVEPDAPDVAHKLFERGVCVRRNDRLSQRERDDRAAEYRGMKVQRTGSELGAA